MAAKGYGIDETNDYLVFNLETKATFYSDADLHGIYTAEGKLVPASDSVRYEINEELGTNLVQHGAHDEWADRLSASAGPNRGPQPPVTAYLPDGTQQHLTTIPEMRAFYQSHGLPWDATWHGQF